MNKPLLPALFFVSAFLPAFAATHSYLGPGYVIPDGNPNGISSSIAVINEDVSLSNVSVTINVSGGYNGDLYGYLNFDGRLVPLLNRAGVSGGNPFGADGAGMNVVFNDGAAQNIHSAGNGFLNGTYRPDGQNVSPLSTAGNFNPGGGAITLNGTFANLNPYGTWTLFLADVVSSGSPGTLNSWSLQLTSVPEPGLHTLLSFLMFVGIASRKSKSRH